MTDAPIEQPENDKPEAATPEAGAPATAPSAPSSARALLAQLQKEYKVLREHLPLAIGVDKQLLQLKPEVNRKHLRAALGMHTQSVRYLKNLQNAQKRFNLDESEASEVNDEQRKIAADTLLERFRKRAKAEKAARADKAKADGASPAAAEGATTDARPAAAPVDKKRPQREARGPKPERTERKPAARKPEAGKPEAGKPRRAEKPAAPKVVTEEERAEKLAQLLNKFSKR